VADGLRLALVFAVFGTVVGCSSQQATSFPAFASPHVDAQPVIQSRAPQLGKQAVSNTRGAAQPGRLLQGPPTDWPAPVHDDMRFTFLRAEQLEYRLRDDGPDVARWEAQGWHGTDYHKLWVKSEGEQSIEGPSEGDVEAQALYSQLVAPFWDFQLGARYDRRWGAGPSQDRWFGVVGIQGFAPYLFETELALFVSEDADVSARITATTDFLITQRLILQPRVEAEVAVHEVPDFQVGRGLSYFDFGLRLRYEFKREFAPYIGVNWIRSFGETEDLVRSDGGQVSDLSFVFGLSVWF
tara:strand:- start:605 stop:1495 length:891 start_codon:yes stop_codon:yes gene_type:complete